MKIVTELFAREVDLTQALADLDAAGFRDLTVFGPDELFKGPAISPDQREAMGTKRHTAAGTVGGISVNSRPYSPGASVQSLEKELQDIGIGVEERETLAAGLQQERMLLLVRTAKPERAAEAQTIMEQYTAGRSEKVEGI